MYGPGDVIHNRYTVEDVLFGAMAEVYVVFDHRSKKKFALKAPRDDFLRGSLETVQEWRSRFEREARNWISLGVHGNIVQAFSYIDASKPILVLEYIDGYDLDRIVKHEPGGMSIPQALEFAIHIATGLTHAHDRTMPRGSGGLIHRDLKPSNVLVTRGCQAKIADFGLSRAKGDTRWTRHFVGSMAYAPPEQFENAHSVTQSADIYSFGVILYEMITGNLPFLPCETKKMVFRIFHDAPEPIETFRNDVDPELRDVIYRCLSKRPGDRPESSRVLLEELRAIENKWHPVTTICPPCANCGYRSKKVHVACPVCDLAQTSSRIGGQEQLRSCGCGFYVPVEYRYCISCGLPSISPEGPKQTTKVSPGEFMEGITGAASDCSKRSCGGCGEVNPYVHIFCSRCGSRLRIGDSASD